jgi:polyhydroxybutyrate depolymerase
MAKMANLPAIQPSISIALLACALVFATVKPGGYQSAMASDAPSSATTTASADPTPSPGQSGTIGLTIDGIARRFILHVPSGLGSPGRPEKVPLVVMLHGAGGGAAGAAGKYDWIAKADAQTFAAVFPEAECVFPDKPESFLTNPRVWKDGSGRGTFRQHSDDIKYLNAVLDDVQRRLSIDDRRIYLTGFSSGASMTWRAAVQMSARFAAVAPVSGHLWLEKISFTADVPPPPVLFIVGDADPLNPINGGQGKNPWGGAPRPVPPMQESIDRWLGAQNIPATGPTAGKVIRDAGGVRITVFGSDPDRPALTYVVIAGQGHEWSGSKRVLAERLTGPNTDAYATTDQVWDFFAAHARR